MIWTPSSESSARRPEEPKGGPVSHPSDAREAEIREWFHAQQQLGLKAPLAAILGDLLATIDTQRRLCAEAATALAATNDLLKQHAQLPVIPTCGDCAHSAVAAGWCHKEDASNRGYSEPPPWCPWRGRQ
jgi:hypothetical protein